MIDRARALPQRAIRQLDFRLRAQPSKQAPAPPGGTGKARTLYQLLGLSNSAINADVRAAYRRLAAQHHPDVAQTPRVLRAGGEAQFFQAINLAYEVLSDPELRRSYDAHGLLILGPRYQFLKEYLGGGGAQGAAAARGSAAPASKRAVKGGDVYAVIGISLTESLTGVDKVLSVNALGCCPQCRGAGGPQAQQQAEGNFVKEEDACAVCRGSGEIMQTRFDAGGKVSTLGLCPGCGGRGYAQAQVCSRCSGEGRARISRGVRLAVPPGVQPDAVLRLPGLGHAGRHGGAAGSLFVKVDVFPDSVVIRKGNDLYSDVTVSVFDALLGCDLTVPTGRGRQVLHVPAGCQHGTVLVLQGAGAAASSSSSSSSSSSAASASSSASGAASGSSTDPGSGDGGDGPVSQGSHFFTVQLAVPNGSTLPADQQRLLHRLAASAVASARACSSSASSAGSGNAAVAADERAALGGVSYAGSRDSFDAATDGPMRRQGPSPAQHTAVVIVDSGTDSATAAVTEADGPSADGVARPSSSAEQGLPYNEVFGIGPDATNYI